MKVTDCPSEQEILYLEAPFTAFQVTSALWYPAVTVIRGVGRVTFSSVVVAVLWLVATAVFWFPVWLAAVEVSDA